MRAVPNLPIADTTMTELPALFADITVPLTLVLTFEALATAPLGCYGCSWNQTPAIDLAASQGVVWDSLTSPTDHPSGLIQRWLTDSEPVVQRCREFGTTRLLTDDGQLDLTEVDSGFDDLTRLDIATPDHPASQLEDTLASKVTAATLDLITDNTSLLWLHSSVLRDVWDAPISPSDSELDEQVEPQEFDDEIIDEGAGPRQFELPMTCQVPSFEIGPDDDPDQLFAWMSRYANQVRLIDSMLELLTLSLSHREPRFLIAGASGFSLGQNSHVGHRTGPLRSSEIRLPMITSTGGPLRCPNLWPAERMPEVLARMVNEQPILSPQEWVNADEEFKPLIVTHSQRATSAITSPKWFIVGDQEGEREKLFLKPDDIDDANDISRLRPEVVDEMLGLVKDGD